MTPFTSNRLAVTGMLSAFAMIAFMIENLFPPVFPLVPYVRLGISNLFVLFALLLYGKREGMCVLLTKTVLGCLLSGRIASFPVGLAGGFSSFGVMALMSSEKKGLFGLCGISAVGSAVGNAFRTVVASLITGATGLVYLLPYAVLFGVAAGFVIGLALAGVWKICGKYFEKTHE